MDDTDDVKLSGAVLLDQLQWVREEYGDDVLERAKSRLSQDAQDELASLLHISWCRASTALALKSALAEAVGRDPLEFQRDLVRRASQRTFGGVWRFLLRRMSDQALVKRAPRLYARSCNRGTMRVTFFEPGMARFAVEGWAEMPEFHAVGYAAALEAGFAFAGRKDVRSTWRRRRPEVHFDVRWVRT